MQRASGNFFSWSASNCCFKSLAFTSAESIVSSLESSNNFRSVTFIIFDFLLAGPGLSANEALAGSLHSLYSLNCAFTIRLCFSICASLFVVTFIIFYFLLAGAGFISKWSPGSLHGLYSLNCAFIIRLCFSICASLFVFFTDTDKQLLVSSLICRFLSLHDSRNCKPKNNCGVCESSTSFSNTNVI